MIRSCSMRARKLVEAAKAATFSPGHYRCCDESTSAAGYSPIPDSKFAPSCYNSPLPQWWDDVFEAADVVKVQQRSIRVRATKRKLSFSPQRSTGTAQPVMKEEACGQDEQQILSNLRGEDRGSCDAAYVSLVNEKHPVALENISNHVDFRCPPKLFPSHLKIHLAKEALNAGREHVTPKGKLRKARSIRAPCPDKCKRCEIPKLSEMERTSINEEFWNLRDHYKQWEYISNSVKTRLPAKKKYSEGCKGGKTSSRVYTFSIQGKQTRVCKTMFRNTLCICDSWVDSAILHCSDSRALGDRRGKHKKMSSEEVKEVQVKS